MNKHTPGPWVASPDPNGSPTDWVIGTTNESRPIDEVAVCNARDANLIAAAPDMLEALTALVYEIDDSDYRWQSKGEVMARVAIAKAKGVTP